MAKLLAVAATVDNRIVTREMVGGWMGAIGHLDYEASVRALHEHRRSSTEYLQPAHIAALVRDEAWSERGLPPAAEREAFEAFVSFTGELRDVAAAHWNDPEWRAERLDRARHEHHERAIEGSA
ncbi:hypothetical protein [Agrococcus pavilionensis]|nr:hypothetical protein [Agrococcus pavilionensis]